MKFRELQQKKRNLEISIKDQEDLIANRWRSMFNGNRPLVYALDILSTSLSKARINPYISIFQAVVFVYQDYIEKKLPTSDYLKDYFVSIADRISNEFKKPE